MSTDIHRRHVGLDDLPVLAIAIAVAVSVAVSVAASASASATLARVWPLAAVWSLARVWSLAKDLSLVVSTVEPSWRWSCKFHVAHDDVPVNV